MFAVSSILPSVNGTGKLHFPGTAPYTSKYGFISTHFYQSGNRNFIEITSQDWEKNSG